MLKWEELPFVSDWLIGELVFIVTFEHPDAFLMLYKKTGDEASGNTKYKRFEATVNECKLSQNETTTGLTGVLIHRSLLTLTSK